MLLAIDIGNTNIKLGLFEKEQLLGSWRLSAATVRTADEYGIFIGNFLKDAGYSFKNIDGLIMSSVIPSLNYTVEHTLNYYMPDVELLTVSPSLKTSITLGYDNPRELGSDRIVNSEAAYTIYGGPCIVIDFGTATTFNAIDKSGVFLGGCICAGMKFSMDALSGATRQLPFIEFYRPESVIGKNTVTNMQSGAVYGLIGQLDYIVKKIKETKGFENAKVIATGGLSEIVAEERDVINVIDRTLTLHGLNIIYNLNKGKIK